MNRLPTKKLLLEMMEIDFPAFQFIDLKSKYRFCEHRNNGWNHFVAFNSSAKNKCYDVSIASTLFPNWDGSYGGNQLKTGCRLPNLRENSKALPVDIAYYYHNGSIKGAQQVLQKISREIKGFGIPWFRKNEKETEEGKLLWFALRWIENNLERIY